MRFGVVTFPGSNCDDDVAYALESVLGFDVVRLWHDARDLSGLGPQDCIVLPGGFSYGDYLRAGAIARFARIMEPIRHFVKAGGTLIGICNGFQILCEAGLLPGALLPNHHQRFICKPVYLRVSNPDTPFTRAAPLDRPLVIPIAHAEGRYYCPPDVLNTMRARGQILLQYCDEDGQCTPQANPNGSVDHIAGIANASFNVFGLMPHPERACEALLGSTDGIYLFQSLVTQRTYSTTQANQ